LAQLRDRSDLRLAMSGSYALKAPLAPVGVVYGAGIFIVMNYVVVPPSAWRTIPSFSTWTFAGNFAAMFLFGLIVAFFWSRETRT
jgi:hypothetical protein